MFIFIAKHMLKMVTAINYFSQSTILVLIRKIVLVKTNFGVFLASKRSNYSEPSHTVDSCYLDFGYLE